MKRKILVTSLLLASTSAVAFTGSFKNLSFSEILGVAPPQVTTPLNGEIRLSGASSTDPENQMITYRFEIYGENDQLVATVPGQTLNLQNLVSSFSLEANKDYVIKFYANDGTNDSAPAVKTFSTRMGDQEWLDFFLANLGTHDAMWNNATISGVTSLPSEPYPNSNPSGSLDFSGGSISNVDSLSSLTSVNSLNLSNNNITDLSGLSNVTSIDGDLILTGNNSLADLSALSNVSTVTGSIELPENIHLQPGYAAMSMSNMCTPAHASKFSPAQTTLNLSPSASLQDAVRDASMSSTLQSNAMSAWSSAADGEKISVSLGLSGVYDVGQTIVSEGTMTGTPGGSGLFGDCFTWEVPGYTYAIQLLAPVDVGGGVLKCRYRRWTDTKSILIEDRYIDIGNPAPRACYYGPPNRYCDHPPGGSQAADFSSPQVSTKTILTDGSGDYYMDGATRVPVYSADDSAMSAAHLEAMGSSYDFEEGMWDSLSNRPTSYQGLSLTDAINLANSYEGTSDPNIMQNSSELPLPPMATQAEACGCTDANADGACD